MADFDIPVWARALAVLGVTIGAVSSLRGARLGPRERRILVILTVVVAAIVLGAMLLALRAPVPR